jgi:tetratricopeptide (TPR) repeat protein
MNVFELSRKQPWFTENPGISESPAGMLGQHESLLCYYFAQQAFTGRGAIIDAGSFLGKSAFFMAQGLRANPNYIAGVHRISCFDNFLVNHSEDGAIACIQNDLRRTLSVGDSTRSIFDSQVARVRDMLDVHAGDFHMASWPGRPIELLMVDIAKSEELGKHVVEIFFPNLIPGASIVIHQDYHHPWLPHIHVVMEYLADYFEIIAPRVDDSAVFLYRKAIPPGILRRAIDYDFTYQERLQLMDSAISRLAPEDRFYVQLARIVLKNGNEDEAVLRRELDDLETRFHQGNHGYSGNAYFENVRQAIDEREGWRQNGERNHARALELADGLLKRRRSGSVLALRGSALLGLGRPREAEHALRAALKFRPPSGYIYTDLAWSLHCQERYDEAEAELLRGMADRDALGPTSRDYLNMLGTILIERNDPSKDTPTLARLRGELRDDPELSALEARLTADRPSAARQARPQPVIEPRQASPAATTPAEPPGRAAVANSAGASRIDPVAEKRPVKLDSPVRKPESTEGDSAAQDNPRPWDQVSIPAAVNAVPSMLSQDEKQYLIWLTSEKFEGWGAIVEAGTWLGSSSAALAEGLRRRSRDNKIHSFDLFRWESYMSDMAGPLLEVGEDFLPLFRKETAPYAACIEPKKVDLFNVSWEGGPIELLFVDSAKTWDLTNVVLKTFGPHLVPGRSRIVLQDFRYHYSHCLPLIFDSRPDVWKQVEDMKYSTTVTFMPLKPLFGPSGIDPNYSEESFPIDLADQLLRSRMAREEPANRYRILQSLYRKYLIDGGVEETLKLREEVCAGGVDETNLKLMENVGDILNNRGWKALTQGDFQTARAIAQRWLSIAREPSVYAFALLGFALLRLGEGEGVKQAIERIRAMSPDWLPGKMLQVEFAISEGRYAEAEVEAREVLDSKPDEVTSQWCRNLIVQAKLHRVELAISEGRYAEAEAKALEVLDSKPDEVTSQWSRNLIVQAKLLRVELAISEGQYAEAEAEAHKVLDSKPNEVTSQWARNLLLQAEAGRKKRRTPSQSTLR